MKNFPIKTLFLVIALAGFLTPAPTQAQSTASLAGLEEDVSVMRDEIRKLREEVENLRTRLDQTQSAAGNNANDSATQARINAQNSATLQALPEQLEQQHAKTRGEIIAQVHQDMDKRFSAMAAETNRAMTALTKQVNDALTKPAPTPATPPRAVENTGNTTPAIPADMPKTGIRYKIKSGDSVYKIARENKSKSAWIFAANKLTPNSTIQAGQEIFIPQKDDAPAPANGQ